MFYVMPGERYKKRAVTLFELTVVVIIIGALSAVTVPVFSGSIVRRRIEGAARRVAADLTLARKRAMQTDSTQTVIFDKARNYYYIQNMPNPLKPTGAHVCKLQDEPYGVRIAFAEFVSATDDPGDAQVVFDIYGQPDSGGWVVLESGDYRWWVSLDELSGKASISRTRPVAAPVVPKLTLPKVLDDGVVPTVI